LPRSGSRARVSFSAPQKRQPSRLPFCVVGSRRPDRATRGPRGAAFRQESGGNVDFARGRRPMPDGEASGSSLVFRSKRQPKGCLFCVRLGDRACMGPFQDAVPTLPGGPSTLEPVSGRGPCSSGGTERVWGCFRTRSLFVRGTERVWGYGGEVWHRESHHRRGG